MLPLAAVDFGFFLANIAKVPQGGWLPVVAAATIFLIMRTWTRGRAIVVEQMRRQSRSQDQFLAKIAHDPPVRVPGVAVFLSSDATGVPRTLDGRQVRPATEIQRLTSKSGLHIVDGRSVVHAGCRRRR